MLHKIATFLEKVWAWIIVSSADPSKTSLTVKGVLGGIVAALVGAMGAVHYQVPGFPEALNNIVDQFAVITQSLLTIVAAVSIVVGIVRKVYNSIFGVQ